TVAWGDGETSSTAAGTVTVRRSTGSTPMLEVVATKPNPYAEEGVELATVTVSDAGRATATARARVTIADAALALTLDNPAPVEGQPIDQLVVVATLTDADPNGAAADYSARVTWGDGQVSTTAAGTAAILAVPGGGFEVRARKPVPYRVAGTLPF